MIDKTEQVNISHQRKCIQFDLNIVLEDRMVKVNHIIINKQRRRSFENRIFLLRINVLVKKVMHQRFLFFFVVSSIIRTQNRRCSIKGADQIYSFIFIFILFTQITLLYTVKYVGRWL